MNRFWSIGDSFVAGEITKLNTNLAPHLLHTNSKEWAFPKWISKELGFEDINLGKGGNSNDVIVSTVRSMRGNVREGDFVLVCLSTPWRGVSIHESNDDISIVKKLVKNIKDIESVLYATNYLITFAFSPICPYLISSEELIQIYNSDRILHWGMSNNTLIDICRGSWLDESKDYIKETKTMSPIYKSPFIAGCGHPNKEGHKKIAYALLPHIQKWL